MENEEKVGSNIIGLLVMCGFLAYAIGCTGNTGWQVGFGVYPISQLHNVQSLQGNQEEVKQIKRKVATGTKEEY